MVASLQNMVEQVKIEVASILLPGDEAEPFREKNRADSEEDDGL